MFKLFSRKKDIDQDQDQEYTEIKAVPTERKREEKRQVRLNTQAERIDYIKDNCDAIIDSGHQVDEAKVEYQAVTSYLADMQKIDLIPLEERGTLEEAASKILSLSKERSILQNKSKLLSEPQYHMFEQYENQMMKELASIKEQEEYQIAISQDMKHLEKERKRLKRERDDIFSKQAFLKGIGIVLSFVVVFLFTLFALLASSSHTDYTIPFIMTVIMAMISACFIFIEARRNIKGMQLVQAKQNRQIMLMNKVKIKSVNNLNYLEYSYNKYMVNNHEQLNIIWQEYLKVKEEERRYQKNTSELDFYNKELMKELKRFGVADTEIWTYQPTAILDGKEMVEVRHRLNVRRQKLRERISLNMNQQEEGLKAIIATLEKYPDCKDEGERLLRNYGIDVN